MALESRLEGDGQRGQVLMPYTCKGRSVSENNFFNQFLRTYSSYRSYRSMLFLGGRDLSLRLLAACYVMKVYNSRNAGFLASIFHMFPHS